MSEEAALALLSEQLLFPGDTRRAPAVGPAKVLLTRPTAGPLLARRRVRLEAAVSDQDWVEYEQQRLVVEAGFGVVASEARSMVAALRTRQHERNLQLYLARNVATLVGAIARFRLPTQPACGRLQEVDVFSPWRGSGYGDGLLAAILETLAGEGCTLAVVGADEDDWPLAWYRSRGFQDSARVPLTR